MTIIDNQPELEAVNLGKYMVPINNEADLPLIIDAAKAATVGAYRAAYIMVWLACAESLKRRFREAAERDNQAGQILARIETMEREHKAIDKVLLDKSEEYGFLSSSDHTILRQIYELRSIYAHPYEQGPSQEKLIDATASVVGIVLSKPVKLRHGFGVQLLQSLLHERIFLDDQESSVDAFVQSILPRIDDNINIWLLEKYWGDLEQIADDPTMAILFRRGIWFSQAMLTTIGTSIFPHETWHDRLVRFPKTLMQVCSAPGLFQGIGYHAQNSLVGLILEEFKVHPTIIKCLEQLEADEALSQRHRERFLEAIAALNIAALRAAGLSTKRCYDRLVAAMTSRDWHVQNPAIAFLASNGPEQAKQLTAEQQENIGRNVLQSADGGAFEAADFLDMLSSAPEQWPFDIVRGVALEPFANEAHKIRIKDYQLHLVLSIIDRLDEAQRDTVIVEIVEVVRTGTLSDRVRASQVEAAVEKLHAYPWAQLIAETLIAKAKSGEDDDTDLNF